MGKLQSYREENFIKMLLLGESGTGKTGALAALARAGYKLNILDFDNGLDVLYEILKDEPEALARINYMNCTDKLASVGGKLIPKGVPKGYSNALNLLTSWSPKNGADEDLGSPSNWGSDTFLVVDSLTHLGNSCLRRVQALNGRSGERITQPEWGDTQNQVETLLALLYSGEFKTNVIITAHVQYIGGEKGKDGEPDDPRPMAGYPNAPGRALAPKIPSYFNTMLLCKQKGTGSLAKREIITTPDGLVGVKNPFINCDMPKTLPVETGLATFVNAALGKTKG